MKLALYTDFVCPYCCIFERGPLARFLERYDVEVEWRFFQLHPQTPPGGMHLSKIIPAARIPGAHQQLIAFATQLGVRIHPGSYVPSTLPALCMAEYARDQGKLHDFRERVLSAHWDRGEDIEDEAVLGRLAEESGLNRLAALSARSERKYLDRLEAARRDAGQRGVSGIPTTFFGDGALVGCRDDATLDKVAEMLRIPRRAEA